MAMRSVILAIEDPSGDRTYLPKAYVEIKVTGDVYVIEVQEINGIVIAHKILSLNELEWLREVIA